MGNKAPKGTSDCSCNPRTRDVPQFAVRGHILGPYRIELHVNCHEIGGGHTTVRLRPMTGAQSVGVYDGLDKTTICHPHANWKGEYTPATKTRRDKLQQCLKAKAYLSALINLEKSLHDYDPDRVKAYIGRWHKVHITTQDPEPIDPKMVLAGVEMLAKKHIGNALAEVGLSLDKGVSLTQVPKPKWETKTYTRFVPPFVLEGKQLGNFVICITSGDDSPNSDGKPSCGLFGSKDLGSLYPTVAPHGALGNLHPYADGSRNGYFYFGHGPMMGPADHFAEAMKSPTDESVAIFLSHIEQFLKEDVDHSGVYLRPEYWPDAEVSKEAPKAVDIQLTQVREPKVVYVLNVNIDDGRSTERECWGIFRSQELAAERLAPCADIKEWVEYNDGKFEATVRDGSGITEGLASIDKHVVQE